METIPEKESVFITGIDSSIVESDLREFLSKAIKSECQIIWYSIPVLKKNRILVEVILSIDDSIQVHQQLNNTKIKDCHVKILPKNTMKSLIITNIPDIISEKDLFILLSKMTTGLKRIIIADNPNVCGRTLNLAVISYQSHDLARAAFQKLQIQNKILGRVIEVLWKEPHFDLLGEIALETTKAIYIKNLSFNTETQKLKDILEVYGKIIRIKKFQDRAFVEFESIESAKKAIENCNENRYDGLVWKIYPAKKKDQSMKISKSDKNSVFSKNFLEEEDQQVLLKFAFDGIDPQVNEKYIKIASGIIQSAKEFQNETYHSLKQKNEEIIAQKQNIVSPHLSTVMRRDSRDSERSESREFFKYSRTSKSEKYNMKQQYKQQIQSMEVPLSQQPFGGIAQNYPNPNIYPINTNSSLDMNLGYSAGANPYHYQSYANPGQNVNPSHVQNQNQQWNMVPQQHLNNHGNFMGQPQFFAENPMNLYPSYRPS